jgi:hypothetical protein
MEDDEDEIKTIELIVKERNTIIGQTKKNKPIKKSYKAICAELTSLKRANKDGNYKWLPGSVHRIYHQEIDKLDKKNPI